MIWLQKYEENLKSAHEMPFFEIVIERYYFCFHNKILKTQYFYRRCGIMNNQKYFTELVLFSFICSNFAVSVGFLVLYDYQEEEEYLI